MITKFDGKPCCFCSHPTRAGVDTYDPDTKKSYHEECFDNQKPGPEAFALADRLLFIRPGDPIPANWITGKSDVGLFEY
jgi:hypothetical protein